MNRARKPPQSAEFDEDYYLQNNPDVAASGVPALKHYLDHGWHEGRRPNSWFDPAAYLERYPDIRIQGIEPLLHFINHGRSEGRFPDERENRQRKVMDAQVDSRIATSSIVLSREQLASEFDASYYISRNSEILPVRADPLEHFLAVGWKEGRNPSRDFDVTRYLEDNSDVATARIDPFLHYLSVGRAEGRRASRPPSAAANRLKAATSAHLRASGWDRTTESSQALTASDLLAALDSESGGSEGIVVVISHDDYDENTGGVQLLIANERDAATAVGFQYLHVSPAIPLPILAEDTDADNFRIRVRLGRRKIGTFTVSALAEGLGTAVAAGTEIDIVIQHLMGHSPQAVSELLLAARVKHPLMWVHDYFTICTDYSLMRNDITFCGAPPISSLACSICCYGEERMPHFRRMEAFFQQHSPVVLAPSGLALELWQRGGLPCSASMVLPPARLLSAHTRLEARVNRSNHRPLRVAHLGAQSYLKGWHVFEDLTQEREGDARYEFLHFGSAPAGLNTKNVRHVDVSVSGRHPLAMVEALVREQVDVVISWQMWAETFSFTAHEAIAAGTFVVARRSAGNVWPAVANHPPVRGLCLDTSLELSQLLAGDGLHDALRDAERFYRPLVHVGGAVDQLLRRRILKRNDQSLLPHDRQIVVKP